MSTGEFKCYVTLDRSRNSVCVCLSSEFLEPDIIEKKNKIILQLFYSFLLLPTFVKSINNILWTANRYKNK